MAQAKQRGASFSRAIDEIIQKGKYRCDASSLLTPDPDWIRIIIGAMDTSLSTPMQRETNTQFRFLFGQIPIDAYLEPYNYTYFKGAIERLVRNRKQYWENHLISSCHDTMNFQMASFN